MADLEAQLTCVELTEAVDEEVADAARWLGQLSGRPLAVEGFVDAADELASGGSRCAWESSGGRGTRRC